jgi:OOP family OmpA-OmpF porin
MNYSTIKKTAVAASLVAALGFAESAQAQTPTVFGGRSQYRTWSIGVQGGITTPNVLVGGSNAFGQKVGYFQNKVGEYYGLTIRKQFSHLFGLELEGNRGRIKTYNHDLSGPAVERTYANGGQARSAEVDVNWAASLNGVFQLGTIDFLRRENAVNFYAKVGLGVMASNPVQFSNNDFTGTEVYNNKGKWGEEIFGDREAVGDRDYKLGAFVPVGVGVKFKLSEVVALNLGYTMNFTDDNLLYGPARTDYKGKFSNVYGGLEFTLGSRDKENLTFTNPVATLYDELKDPSLRNEVEALKQRVSTLEGTVDQLSKDSDGDGVSDKFDKCPGTPAGTAVDGSGCPIKFPEPVAQNNATTGAYYAPIQFEFDSSVLKTESYSTLDRLAKELRDNNATVTLDGYASAEGTEAYNLNLSKDRANAVKQYLVNAGVPASSITANGYGEANPVASNATEEGRIQNRRVEIKK